MPRRALLTTLLLATAPLVAQPKPTPKPKEAAHAAARAERPAKPEKPEKAASATTKVEPVDINTATVEQLKAVPGIGDVYAAKIIAGRPYVSKDQLRSKKILPPAVYAKVRDRLVARGK